jgi:predicted aspartyl protease
MFILPLFPARLGRRASRRKIVGVTSKEPMLAPPHFRAMKAVLTAVMILALPACEFPTIGVPTEAPEYRPGEAGTVDHALCLLGFTAVALRRTETTGHHLIAARLNSRDALFVVDTGANLSVVDDNHAAAFGLAGTGIGRGGVSTGGRVSARQVPIDSLSIGGVPVRQRRMIVADLGQISDFLRPLAGGAVHGLIGQDVLNEHRAVIDVDRPILYLMAADRDPAPVPAERCRGTTDEPPAKRSGNS